jgi:hypothetical protein
VVLWGPLAPRAVAAQRRVFLASKRRPRSLRERPLADHIENGSSS